MFGRFLNTPKGFMVLSLTSKHLNYCLNTSKIDTDTMLLVKKLNNQSFTNYYFPFKTIFVLIKHVQFRGYNFETV